jgi:hypothetical protein
MMNIHALSNGMPNVSPSRKQLASLKCIASLDLGIVNENDTISGSFWSCIFHLSGR